MSRGYVTDKTNQQVWPSPGVVSQEQECRSIQLLMPGYYPEVIRENTREMSQQSDHRGSAWEHLQAIMPGSLQHAKAHLIVMNQKKRAGDI